MDGPGCGKQEWCKLLCPDSKEAIVFLNALVLKHAFRDLAAEKGQCNFAKHFRVKSK